MSFKSGILGLSLLSITQGVFAAEQDNVRIIIKYKHSSSLAVLKSQIAKSTHVPVNKLKPMANGAYSLFLDASQLVVNSNNDDKTTILLGHLRKNPDVLYAVKDRVGYFKPIPDPISDSNLSQLLSHNSQWDEFIAPAGVKLESAPGLNDGAWAYTKGKAKKPVVVAVLDTGIALNESIIDSLVKDSNGKVWGWNFAGDNDDLVDETKSYHGTHVAGTIAGYGGVMNGMGENLKILTVKIPAKNGMFYESAVINGIYWSVGAAVPGVPANIHPAKVLNMSFGVDIDSTKEMDYCGEALQEAVFFARKKGAVLAVAAGNDNIWEHFNAPGVCNGTIKVASTGPEGLRSYFSNYGPSITFAAPGGDKRYGTGGGILSTVNPGGGYNSSGFDFYQGTSMASPHVAGVAGLVYAISDRDLKAEQVEQILYVTTHDFGKTSDANKSCIDKKPCGHGILDAENAVKTALTGYDVLFSAPAIADLNTPKCSATVSINGGVWLAQQDACPMNGDINPHTEYKEGEIYANYGSARYKLDLTQYKECHVIGYDGVGCYL